MNKLCCLINPYAKCKQCPKCITKGVKSAKWMCNECFYLHIRDEDNARTYIVKNYSGTLWGNPQFIGKFQKRRDIEVNNEDSDPEEFLISHDNIVRGIVCSKK